MPLKVAASHQVQGASSTRFNGEHSPAGEVTHAGLRVKAHLIEAIGAAVRQECPRLRLPQHIILRHPVHHLHGQAEIMTESRTALETAPVLVVVGNDLTA